MWKVALLVTFALFLGNSREVDSIDLDAFFDVNEMVNFLCKACLHDLKHHVLHQCILPPLRELDFLHIKECLLEFEYSSVKECIRTCCEGRTPPELYWPLEMFIGMAYNESIKGFIDCFPPDSADLCNYYRNLMECSVHSVRKRMVRLTADILEDPEFTACLSRRTLKHLEQCSNDNFNPTGKVHDGFICILRHLMNATSEC
ncbi:hypothetical protein MATL_G00193000 [Megalops atlanticus]|uniref:Uncharacterized protein n=1 Tax=Megalops atlanticus TaxID=7932 RepID=A0A9D3SYF0_MEGAT|nr:hypothetical protein MATL_G00193000 [Megalops atlanticus]